MFGTVANGTLPLQPVKIKSQGFIEGFGLELKVLGMKTKFV